MGLGRVIEFGDGLAGCDEPVTEYVQSYQLWMLRQEDCYESKVRLGNSNEIFYIYNLPKFKK